MLAPNELKRRIADVFDVRQAQVLDDWVDLQNVLVKASDFAELKATIAEAQKASDTRMTRVEAAIERLDASVERLVEAQARTDGRVSGLEAAMERLAAAQLRTEERMTGLEAAMGQLAAAQVRTEQALGRLSVEVGSLKNHFGFSLEEFVAALLPPYLTRHYGVSRVELERRFFTVDQGRQEEIDLVGEGTRDGQPITILVECSARLGGSEVRRTARKIDRVVATLGERTVAKVAVGMHIHPSAVEAAEELGIWLIPYSRINRERE